MHDIARKNARLPNTISGVGYSPQRPEPSLRIILKVWMKKSLRCRLSTIAQIEGKSFGSSSKRRHIYVARHHILSIS